VTANRVIWLCLASLASPTEIKQPFAAALCQRKIQQHLRLGAESSAADRLLQITVSLWLMMPLRLFLITISFLQSRFFFLKKPSMTNHGLVLSYLIKRKEHKVASFAHIAKLLVIILVTCQKVLSSTSFNCATYHTWCEVL